MKAIQTFFMDFGGEGGIVYCGAALMPRASAGWYLFFSLHCGEPLEPTEVKERRRRRSVPVPSGRRNGLLSPGVAGSPRAALPPALAYCAPRRADLDPPRREKFCGGVGGCQDRKITRLNSSHG